MWRRRGVAATPPSAPRIPAVLAPLTLALAQVDARVGDLDGNVAIVREQIARARDAGAELVLFPELMLTGYPPEDLLLKEHFLQAAQEALAAVAADAQGIVALVGFPERSDDPADPRIRDFAEAWIGRGADG